MKREILFRGYSEALNKWVEGLLNQYQSKIYITQEKIEQPTLGDPGGTWIYNEYEVHPDSVGQFTGLCDCNGVKIFDNDIISVKVKHGFNSDLLNEFKEKNNLDSLNGIGSHFSGIVRLDFLRGVMFENPENGYREPMFTRHLDIMRNHSEITITGNTFKP